MNINIKKHILPLAAVAALGAPLTSCGDFLSEYSQDMIVAKTVYDFDEVMLGNVYLRSSAVSTGPTGFRTCGFLNILDDDVNTGNVGSETSKTWGNCLSQIFGYYAWQLRVGSNYNASNFGGDNTTWDDLYARINIVNVILDEIPDMPHEKEDEYATYLRVQGEAHFCRAYAFFTLANLYGDAYEPSTAASKLCVPLKLTPYVEHDRDKDTQFERATVKEIYDQIVYDLGMAEQYLKESPQNPNHRLHRASYEAVELLFSRVYLYMQEWALAEQKADEVIKSQYGQLATIALLESGPFLTRSNPEILFSQGANCLAREDLFTARPGDFCVTKELRSLYSSKDRRGDCFFGTHMSDSITLTGKYERGSIVSHISDVFTLRVAEAYLNKAEACAMQGGKDSEACAALNKLKANRIEDYESVTLSGQALVDEIRDERRRELCFEGHRWFDLRRYAVNQKYPFSKQITHVYHACGDYGVSYSNAFILEEHDLAYTFAIPESVIKFDDVPMPDNKRKTRKPIEIEIDDDEEEGDDDPTKDPEL